MTSRNQGDASAMQRVARAVADIRDGKPVVVGDAPDRENEYDLIFASQCATPGLVGFVVRHTSGLLCCAMTAESCDRLQLPPMVEQNTDAMRTAFTISVDAADGTTTGISASDRALTLMKLADPATEPVELLRPGHVFPLRAHEEGVLGRQGHTEAAVDLAVLAGLEPSGSICELIDDSGELLRAEAAAAFAEEHGLTVISVDELIAFRQTEINARERSFCDFQRPS